MRVDLEHGQIGARIDADDPGVELPAIEQPDGDFVRAVNHVIVGQDVAVAGHNESRARALLEFGPLLRLHAPREELLESRRNLELGTGRPRPALRIRLDEDDARLDLLGHRRKRLTQAVERRRTRRRRPGGRLRGGEFRGRLLGRGGQGKVQEAGDEQACEKCNADAAGYDPAGPSVRHERLSFLRVCRSSGGTVPGHLRGCAAAGHGRADMSSRNRDLPLSRSQGMIRPGPRLRPQPRPMEIRCTDWQPSAKPLAGDPPPLASLRLQHWPADTRRAARRTGRKPHALGRCRCRCSRDSSKPW